MEGMVAGSELGFNAFGIIRDHRDDFFSLPEEVQEQVNAHAEEFHSEEEMRRYIRNLMRKA